MTELERAATNGREEECPECGDSHAMRYDLTVNGKKTGTVVACSACGLSRDEKELDKSKADKADRAD